MITPNARGASTRHGLLPVNVTSFTGDLIDINQTKLHSVCVTAAILVQINIYTVLFSKRRDFLLSHYQTAETARR